MSRQRIDSATASPTGKQTALSKWLPKTITCQTPWNFRGLPHSTRSARSPKAFFCLSPQKTPTGSCRNPTAECQDDSESVGELEMTRTVSNSGDQLGLGNSRQRFHQGRPTTGLWAILQYGFWAETRSFQGAHHAQDITLGNRFDHGRNGLCDRLTRRRPGCYGTV